MSEELEEDLQKQFINDIIENDISKCDIHNEWDLNDNFKRQISRFNGVSLDGNEFDEILNYLNSHTKKDTLLKLKKTLRLSSKKKIRFIDFSDFSNNIFQVCEEVTMNANRYDVVVLINGIPIIQIELKKSGVDLRQAFGQIIRYKTHSHENLFNFIQLFVISNKVYTKYFLNEDNLSFNRTFIWQDGTGKEYPRLDEFTSSFLTPQNIIEVLSKFIFMDYFASKKVLLRPYQINAIKNIFHRIEDNQSGYVWHTYGSGKTLTSLHLAMLLENDDSIDNIVYITRESLSKFPQDYVSRNSNQFLHKLENDKLVITSINKVFSKDFKENFERFIENRIVFIYDEYEKEYPRWNPIVLMDIFKNSLFYCFTGAPIFDENIKHDMTTKYLFGSRIDSYVFKDSLVDKNGLNMQVHYLDDEDNKHSLSKKRYGEIAENILTDFDEKTLNGKFNAILFVDNNHEVIMYNELLRSSQLDVVPILRFNVNEEFNGMLLRDYFDLCLSVYNKRFSTDFSTNSVGHEYLSGLYEADIVERMRNREIDLLILDKTMLDDQFQMDILSGLNCSFLNTIYIDADLDYGNIVKVISLTNSPMDEDKLYGNIVLFRNIEDKLNDALKLFSNENSSEDFQLNSVDFYEESFNESLEKMSDVNEEEFMKCYDRLSDTYKILSNFPNYEIPQNKIDEFNRFKTEYERKINIIRENRKELDDFNLVSINKFRLDSQYIDSLFDEKDDEIKINPEYNQVNNIYEHNEVTNNYNTVNNEFRHHNVSVNNNFFIINSHDESYDRIQLDDELVNSINSNEFIIENNDIFTPNDVDEVIESNVIKRKVKPKFDLRDDFKVCTRCNKLQDSSEKFCKVCGNVLDELSESVDLKKICPNCKSVFDDFAFCKNCGTGLIDLDQYLTTLTKICPECGMRQESEHKYCKRCNTPLKELKIYKDVNIEELVVNSNEKYHSYAVYRNKLDSMDEILTEENLNALNDYKLTSKQYDDILSYISDTSSEILQETIEANSIDYDSISIFEKVLLSSKSFATVEFKSSGSDFGIYKLNKIKYDQRDYASNQITTLIHELSHHILFEIFKQILMLVLDTQETYDLEFLIAFTLGLGENNLMDEFCAHTVQGRFIPRGFQEYASFESLIEKFNIKDNSKLISYYALAGNSFAQDIKKILENHITSNLIEEIKEQFRQDIQLLSKSDGIFNEFDETFDEDVKLDFIISTLKNGFEIAYSNPEKINKLKYK